MKDKALKPSEYLKRDSKNAFIDFLLAMTMPEWRKCFMGYDDHLQTWFNTEERYFFGISLDGYLKHLPKRKDNSILCEIVDGLTESIKNCVILNVYSELDAHGWDESARERKLEEDIGVMASIVFDYYADQLFYDLHRMARYLIPGDRVISMAIDQILDRPQSSLQGSLGSVFAECFDSIGKTADIIADAIVAKYLAQYGASQMEVKK